MSSLAWLWKEERELKNLPLQARDKVGEVPRSQSRIRQHPRLAQRADPPNPYVPPPPPPLPANPFAAEATVPEWFAIERGPSPLSPSHLTLADLSDLETAYTAEALVDVSVMLTNYRDENDVKIHEIALVVAHGWGPSPSLPSSRFSS